MPTEKPVYEKVTISLPKGLSREAQDAGFNVSALCAQCIRVKLSIIETTTLSVKHMKEFKENRK